MNAGQSGMEPPLPANGYARQGSAESGHEDADLDTLLAGQPLDLNLKRELEHLDSIDLEGVGIGRGSGPETRESTPATAARNPLAANSPEWTGGSASEPAEPPSQVNGTDHDDHAESRNNSEHAASVGASAPSTPIGAQGHSDMSGNLPGDLPDLPLITAMDDDSANRVSAYARLDFESFTFYVQTLQVVLGRKPEHGGGQADVDVHLGPAKAISRRHAKIFYNFATQRFELTVIGRNGAFVGDVFVETGSTVPLRDSTKVQIGQIAFNFVLPLQGDEREAVQNTPLEDEVEIEETGDDETEEHTKKSRDAKGSKLGSEKGRGGKLKQRTQSQAAKAKPQMPKPDREPHPLASGPAKQNNSRPSTRAASQPGSHIASPSSSQSQPPSQPPSQPSSQPQSRPHSQASIRSQHPQPQSRPPSHNQQHTPSHQQSQQKSKPKPKVVKKEDENNLFAQTSADQAVESAIASLPEMAGFRSDTVHSTQQPAAQNHANSELEGLNALLQGMPGFPDRGGHTGQPAAAPQTTVPGYTNVQDLPELQPGLLGHSDGGMNTGHHQDHQQWAHTNPPSNLPQSLQGLQGLQSSLQSLQNLQGIPGLQNLQGLQGLQGLEGLQNLQTLLGLPGLGNMQPASGMGTMQQMPQSKPLQQKQKRKPKREYRPDEIPEQYRTKPSHSYSHLITAALRDRLPVMPDGTASGLSLADIYEAIMDLFPYYRYCAPGWQNSVRHNLSSSKSFRKVSKEGKGWLWGLDEVYLAEKEKQRQRALARQQQQALAQQQAMAQQQAREQAREQARLAQLARDREREAEQRQILAERAQRAARAGVPLHALNATLGMSFKPSDSPTMKPPPPPPQERPANPTVLPAETVKLLAGLQQHVQQKLASEGQPPLNPQLLSNALAVVIAQTAKKAGGLQHLASVLQQPDAVQKLLNQAMQLLRSTQRVPSGPSSASSTPVSQSPQPEQQKSTEATSDKDLPSEAQVKAQPHVQTADSHAPVPSQHAQPHILQPQPPAAEPSQQTPTSMDSQSQQQSASVATHSQPTKETATVSDAGSPVVISVGKSSVTSEQDSQSDGSAKEGLKTDENPSQSEGQSQSQNQSNNEAPQDVNKVSSTQPPGPQASAPAKTDLPSSTIAQPAASQAATQAPTPESQQAKLSQPSQSPKGPAASPAAGPPPSQPTNQGSQQQPKPAKAPPSLEKITEILTKAEAIPNPSAEVKGMIEKLKAHKRQLELKRSADAAVPSGSTQDAPAPKRQAVE